ncbi:hypothetical protein [Pararhizobium sp. DWP3-4]|uniref:hypothetical protein n=1 Tax=Pararhizobium sp. DWP3-4 TaxID=2804565 RepID=UPI003CEB45BB
MIRSFSSKAFSQSQLAVLVSRPKLAGSISFKAVSLINADQRSSSGASSRRLIQVTPFQGFEHRLRRCQKRAAGEKVVVAYSGKRVPIADRNTGKIREAEIFLAVLGASSFI